MKKAFYVLAMLLVVCIFSDYGSADDLSKALPSNTVLALALSPDGHYLATVIYMHKKIEVKIWDVKCKELAKTIDTSPEFARVLSYSPDGKLLALGAFNGGVKIWDTYSWKRIETLWGHRSGVTTLVFSGNSKRLASASSDGTLILWDIEKLLRDRGYEVGG